MVQKLHAKGFDECMKLVSNNTKPGISLFLLFSGSKDASGQSWCPDCVKAEPIIEEALESASEDAVFIEIEVGERPYWKDQNNPFRTDSRLNLKCVPTLLRYGTPQRLEEEQCFDLDNVKMLFEDS